jgi:invasion protein IalB
MRAMQSAYVVIWRLLVAASFVGAAAHIDAGKANAEEPVIAAQPRVAAPSWVKLCDKAHLSKLVPKPDPTLEPTPEPVNVCITHFERLASDTGLPNAGATVRVIDGQAKMRFLVTVDVPAGITIAAGLSVTIDGKEPFGPMPYTVCRRYGCLAEADATLEFVARLRTGKSLHVVAMSAEGERIRFEVPLDSFARTFAGEAVKPVREVNRKDLLRRIREAYRARTKRQQERLPGTAAKSE